MNRERAINIGIVLLIVVLLAFVAFNCIAQEVEQTTVRVVCSEPCLGIREPTLMVGVFEVFPGAKWGFDIAPDGPPDATGINPFDPAGAWIPCVTEWMEAGGKRDDILWKEVDAWVNWKGAVPRYLSISFAAAWLGAEDFRDIAGNIGYATPVRREFDRRKPVAEILPEKP